MAACRGVRAVPVIFLAHYKIPVIFGFHYLTMRPSMNCQLIATGSDDALLYCAPVQYAL